MLRCQLAKRCTFLQITTLSAEDINRVISIEWPMVSSCFGLVVLVSLLFYMDSAGANSILAEAQQISFPGSVSAPNWVLVIDRQSGVSYEASLVADPDNHGQPIVVNLVVRRSGSKAGNLIKPSGNWHGMEPFSMAASEFQNGEHSVFGLYRRVPIQTTHDVLSVEIMTAQVFGCRLKLGCAFSSVSVSLMLVGRPS